jgi:outer membrane lipase/esterase
MGQRFLTLAGLILITPLYPALASSFTGITAFGDSLSDNGNAFIATGGTFPGSNYAVYTFAGTPSLTTSFYSDGPNTSPVATGPQGLWIDQLASRLGVADPRPVLAGGTNYAVASAVTGTSSPFDVGSQVGAFLATHPGTASSTDLYTLWAGANDIFAGSSATKAADNIDGYIQALAVDGAKTFLWPNLPPLGDTPKGAANKAALDAASAAFNGEWAKDIAALQGQGIDVIGVDIGKLFAEIAADPTKFGYTNLTQSAQTSGAATDAGYLFWDDVHPTTVGHMYVADAAFNALTATPEPASVSLAVFGVVALAFAAQRVRRSSNPN